MSTNTAAKPLQPLRNYIRQNLGRIRSSPCLLIASSPPPEGETATRQLPNQSPDESPSSTSSDRNIQQSIHRHFNDPKIHAFVQRNTQTLVNEFNLRSVPCTISSAFPTSSGVRDAISLAKRAGLKEAIGGSTGEGVVIGIGSGPAMDLAKAVADTLFGSNIIRSDGFDGDDGGKLILAPSTLGGLWAASTNSPSLLLDTTEEMLLPHLPPSWGHSASRKGTVVTLDPARYLAFSPLISAIQTQSTKDLRSISSSPSMAHVAGALLSVLLDTARLLDTSNNSKEQPAYKSVISEMKEVASLCASVLNLAAELSNDNSRCNRETAEDPPSSQDLALQRLLEIIPRHSLVIEQSSYLIGETSSVLIHGTLPQTLANALLPSHFPKCHLITYLACTLPGLCDVLAASSHRKNCEKGLGNLTVVEELASSILNGSSTEDNLSWELSSWASRISTKAGIPTLASLAFGAPDLKSLVGALDSYESLMASFHGGCVFRRGANERWILEDILQKSLDR
mmetsp:Transcript_24714/g.51293  ORF Transcript_24714/g.51293 Transcript_24714/m.51293 type:complete len:510 (-) Transcript_24714:47-1576(-)